MIVIGLILLIAAVIVGVVGLMANGGDADTLTSNFSVFGYQVTGTTGTVFLYGIVVGVVGMFGLSLLLAGARHTAHRGRVARRDRDQARADAAAASEHAERRDIAYANSDDAGIARTAGASRVSRDHAEGRSWRHPFGHGSVNAAHQ